MARISGCVIAYNEEKKIGACLESLAPVVDEIVVVDSGSSDATVAIAERHGARVVMQPFLGYVEQKNFAVGQAANDWILSLDCDECLSAELIAEIARIKPVLEEHDAYRMARKTFYVDQWLEHCWYPDRKVRLFDRRSARWGGINPHDRVETEGRDIVTLRGDILHYSFDSISQHLATIDRFTEIGAAELVKKGRRVGLFEPVTHALWAFIKLYIVKRGFLDGFSGFVVSVLSAGHCFVKYSKARLMLRHQAGKSETVH